MKRSTIRWPSGRSLPSDSEVIITSANITADMRITGDSIQKDPYFAMTYAKSHPDSLFVEGFFLRHVPQNRGSEVWKGRCWNLRGDR